MRLRSLGYRTDLLFPRFEGEIHDRGSYLVIRTPKNPGFYWGNFLLFDRPPEEGDHERWTELFRREIGGPSGTHHMAFGWDSVTGEPGAIEPLLADGFDQQDTVVLSTERLTPPPHANGDVEVRVLTTDDEWEAALDNQVVISGEGYEPVSYREFRGRTMERYRAMARKGLGNWYGAFLKGRLVGDLGLYVDKNRTLGRYQAVGTHPDFRRQGICGALVVAAGEDARKRFGVSTLVITADPDYHALRLYESVGFRPTERQIGVCKA